MKIVIAVEGTRGDVQPMLVLGSRLRQQNHHVVMCGPPRYASEATSAGLEFHGFGFDFERALQDNSANIVAGGRRALTALNGLFVETLESQFALVPGVVDGAATIVGAGASMASTSAAELVKAPHYTVGYVPTLFPSSEHLPGMLSARSLPRLANALAWRVMGYGYNLLLRSQLNEHRERLRLPQVSDAYHAFLGRRALAAFDEELARIPADAPCEISPVGYLHDSRPVTLPEDVQTFIGSGPPPIYLGFGSMADPHPEETTATICRAATLADVRLILSRGSADLGHGVDPERVLVVNDLPHAALFPRCAATVHHGGAGTTAVSARAGVPQLIVPHYLDQPFWGRRAHALGLGPSPIPRSKLTSERLAAALRELAGVGEYHDRARALGVVLQSRDAAGRAADVVSAGWHVDDQRGARGASSRPHAQH